MKKVTENREFDRLRKLAERDPGLLEVIDGLRATKGQKRAKDKQTKRLRMPYVNAEPLTEGSWK